MFKAALRIAWKDVVGDFRRRVALSSMLFFAIAVLIVFQAAFEPGRLEAYRLLPGLLWATILFTTLVGLGRVFMDEEEDGAIEALILSPAPRGMIYLGKWLGNLSLTVMVEFLLVPLTLILFNVDGWGVIHKIMGVLLLGTLGLTGLGVLLAALAHATRSRETMLALLLLPLVAPLLIAGVQSLKGILDGQEVGAWIQLMTIFDVVFLTLAPWAFGWLVEE